MADIQTFPDLRSFKDPMGMTRWCSPGATQKVTDIETVRDSDGRLWMLPHLRSGKIFVYGNPPAIVVARAVENGFGYQPEPGWEDVFTAAGYTEDVLKCARGWLRQNPPISWDTPEEPSGKPQATTP